MPVRRRKSKARASDVKAWAEYLSCGHDFFGELAGVGLTEATARPLAEQVWHATGEAVIAYLDEMHRGFAPPERPYWAERVFGSPGKRRRRPCR